MKYSVRLARIIISLLILIILIFVGCQRAGRTDSSAPDNTDVQIALQPAAQAGTMTVILTNSSGAAITDAKVALEGNMDHPGMMPVDADAVTDNADGKADGRYTLPFKMEMLGDWIITVSVTQADGSTFKRDLPIQVSEQGIKGDSIKPLDDAGPNGGNDTVNGQASGATIRVEKQMARPAPLAGGTGAVYLTLINEGKTPVKLMGADTPAAGSVEIHSTENDNGVMKMRQITDGIEIDPGKSVELTPGTMHMMLVKLKAPLAEGDTLKVTLHFEGADDVTVDVPVMKIDASMSDGM